MARTPDSNTEKLALLYMRRAFLEVRLELQQESYEREKLPKYAEAIKNTSRDIGEVQFEIDLIRDLDL